MRFTATSFALFFFVILSVSGLASEKLKPEPSSKNLYARLGLTSKAEKGDIRRSYTVLARKYHPDFNPDDKVAEENFKSIQEAYDILSDPKKRAVFDQILSDKDGVAFQSAMSSNGNDRHFEKDEYFEEELAKLLALKEKYPELADLIENVLEWDVYSRIERIRNDPERLAQQLQRLQKNNIELYTWLMQIIGNPKDPRQRMGIYVLPIEHHFIWPSETHVVNLIMESGNDFLLRTLAYNMATLPGWEDHVDKVLELVNLNNESTNSLLGEFIYAPQWVNERGVLILERLIDLGYYTQVARSLGIAGGIQSKSKDGKWVQHPSWYGREDGRNLMLKLVMQGNSKSNDHLNALTFDTDHSPWSKALRAHVEDVADVPYVSTSSIKQALGPDWKYNNCKRLMGGEPATTSATAVVSQKKPKKKRN